MNKLKFTKRKAISFDKDFEVILDKFELLTKGDTKMKESIPKTQINKIKKCGMFSHSVKYLIRKYVDRYWEEYCKSKGVKNET